LILIKSNIINHFKQMDFIVILFMMLLVKKPCFCNNETMFYNSSWSSNKFKSFYSSLCSLFLNFIKCIIFFNDYFHTFESFPHFPSSSCGSSWSQRFLFQIYVPCVQGLLNGFYHSKFTMQFRSKLKFIVQVSFVLNFVFLVFKVH